MIDEEVTPVWSEKALWGMFDDADPPEDVVGVDELVELHAAAVTATANDAPTTAIRRFHDPDPTGSPFSAGADLRPTPGLMDPDPAGRSRCTPGGGTTPVSGS